MARTDGAWNIHGAWAGSRTRLGGLSGHRGLLDAPTDRIARERNCWVDERRGRCMVSGRANHQAWVLATAGATEAGRRAALGEGVGGCHLWARSQTRGRRCLLRKKGISSDSSTARYTCQRPHTRSKWQRLSPFATTSRVTWPMQTPLRWLMASSVQDGCHWTRWGDASELTCTDEETK
jgi:hypothetical protein